MGWMRAVLVAAGLLIAAPPSMAAQTTTSFTVSTTVARSCLVSATNLSFGPYPAIATAPTLTATATITVTCQFGDTFSIFLNDGANGAGAQRRMARVPAPPAFLNYNLFRDPAMTSPWSGFGARDGVDGVGSGLAQSFTVYGQLPGGQLVPVGAYVDTVTVTVRN